MTAVGKLRKEARELVEDAKNQIASLRKENRRYPVSPIYPILPHFSPTIVVVLYFVLF